MQLLAQQYFMNSQYREVLQHPAGSQGQEESFLPMPYDNNLDTHMISDPVLVEPHENNLEQPAPKNKKGKGRASSSPYEEGEIERAIRSKPPRSKEANFTNDRGIFVDDWGMPKKFYIMVDLKNRKDFLKIVKVRSKFLRSNCHILIARSRNTAA